MNKLSLSVQKNFLFSLVFSILCTELHALDIDTKGFLTFAYRKSDSEILYDNSVSKDGDFSQGTQAGMQFFSAISKRVDGHIQVLADGDDGRDISFKLDIAHININLNNRHKFLAGKIRLPVWMISDFIKVGSLYPWINPPEEVYEIVPLETIGNNDTFYGLSFEGFLFKKGHQDLSYRFYNGGNENDRGNIRTRVKNLHGVVLDYRNDVLNLKASYLNALSTGERETSVGTFQEESFGRGEFFSFGARFDGDFILAMSEYSKVLGDNPAYEEVDSYYLMLGTHLFNQDILLHGTFSEVLDSSKSNIDIFQKTYTFGVNYNIDLSTVIKFEYKVIGPKRKPVLPPPGPPGTITQNSPAGLFERNPERDVRFFSISVNTMF